ncbi:TetR/AcrR family transcriptional regulator [Phenylobacterium aquaticum]|uniref:TetR/AcrR family transcriptional regulator n=1 Tax=Phenylobacterium aquaticum TaxID=1763816 RepID=UPI0026EABE04|nr:TetR/AcrR family transcriptional regulator [Phenylobacterium aquaticum]
MKINLEARALNAELRRGKTRGRIFEAASEVIARKGPHSVTIEDIVNAAGIARGTFYNYFQSTAELVSAVASEMAQSTDLEIEAQIQAIEDPAEAFATFGAMMASRVVGDPTRTWINLQQDRLQTQPPNAFVLRFEAILARGVEAGRFRSIDPLAARALALGSARAAIRNITSGQADVSHAAEVLALILVALGVPADEATPICVRAIEAAGHGRA